MKLAIMQPYLFPYVGYFQLLAGVDKFVFYDDVNFIKRGWINRNRLLLSGGVHYITIPLSGASAFLKINQIDVQQSDKWRRKILTSVRHSYSKAPNFNVVYDLFSKVLLSDESRISELAKQSIIAVSKYLGLETQFVMSSSIYGNSDLNGVDRILDICQKEKASQYYNLPGGREFYDGKIFEKNGVLLHFTNPRLNTYKQFSEEFYPGLSIVDVLMFNSPEEVSNYLLKFELIK